MDCTTYTQALYNISSQFTLMFCAVMVEIFVFALSFYRTVMLIDSHFTKSKAQGKSVRINLQPEYDEHKGKVILVSLEGNISAGKSTLIKILKEKTKDDNSFMIVDEPVDVWEKITDDGKTILEAFYEDPKKMAFTFQICALYTRYECLKRIYVTARKRSQVTGVPTVVLIERTILSDYHIFAKMLHASGHITNFEMKIYELWFNNFIDEFDLRKSIYLKAPPKLCYDRVAERNRNGEDKITLAYLDSCDKQHEEFYTNVLSKHGCMIFDNSVHKDSKEYHQNVEKIIEYFRPSEKVGTR